jgi:hypothetical protein
MKFDIVISSCKKDQFILQKAIESIKKYVINFRRIIVVSSEKLTNIVGVEWFDEKNYPFNIKDIYDNMYNLAPEETRRRKVSYINQLIKLYAHKVIPNLTDNILIYDSDIIFIKKTYFFDNDIPLYGNRIVKLEKGYINYLNHHLKLNKNFDFLNNIEVNKNLKKKGLFCSGICHHIIYNKYIIEEIINLIEKQHNQIFWKYYLNIIDTRDKNKYNHIEPANCELYYNYVVSFHNDKVKIRNITWKEKPAKSKSSNNIIINYDKQFVIDKKISLQEGHNYIAYHSYNREIINL